MVHVLRLIPAFHFIYREHSHRGQKSPGGAPWLFRVFPCPCFSSVLFLPLPGFSPSAFLIIIWLFLRPLCALLGFFQLFRTFLRFSSCGSFLFLAVLCPFDSGIFPQKLLFCQAAHHHVISLHGDSVHSASSQYGFLLESQSVQYLT